jgi:hypothetical protein
MQSFSVGSQLLDIFNATFTQTTVEKFHHLGFSEAILLSNRRVYIVFACDSDVQDDPLINHG